MVTFLRTPTATSALPAAAAVLSSSNHLKHHRLAFSASFAASSSSSSSARLLSSGGARHARAPLFGVKMDSPLTVEVKADDKKDEMLAELLTEFMVDMKCDGCVSAVKNKLSTIDGIKRVDADLENQVVKVLGTVPVTSMLNALEQTGRKARLIGQGNPEDFLVSAAVAEFKGPVIFGVVRLAQVNMELARIEANFSGLSPGKHGWAINEFGDLTRGAKSTGEVFDPPLGDLGTLEAQDNGEAHFSGSKHMLKVADLIGRAIALYETEDKSDEGVAAAVIARSAGVGENYKKLCTCDGVTIWESS